ncbi:putative cytochrome b5 protein [Lipomyces orientalis]|uniref:Cytochrome b5 protein n=1 Tax=Lipomyces orientalis TaxID=1233043 RepID=A0ACC3TYL8_9ASCO
MSEEKTVTVDATAEKTYLTFENVKSHTTQDDLWMVIHGKVYNCTKFIDEHPGGEEVLLDVGGMDATDAFEDVGHSEEARKILDELCIGELDPSDVVSSAKSPSTSDGSKPTSSGGSGFFSYIAIAAVVLAVGYYAYMQSLGGSKPTTGSPI